MPDFSSAVPQDYLAASGARIRMTLDFQAKEVDDGYQYVQILADQTSACDSGAGSRDPGTLRASSYLAGFELWKGNTLAEYATLSFPVTSAGNNCGAVSTPWKDTGHNDLGNLCQQRFAANCRAADGRLSLPASLSTLGVRFDASGSGNDDWVAKSVVARLQAVPAGPGRWADPAPAADAAPDAPPPPLPGGAPWWTLFGDETLDALEAALLAQSPSLAASVARLDAAAARLGIDRDGLMNPAAIDQLARLRAAPKP